MPRIGRPGSVAFRDDKGRFVKHSERYTEKVVMIQAFRSGLFDEVSDRYQPGAPKKGPLATPDHLATLLTPREFESLKEATIPIATYHSEAKYKAWDIARQIDQTRGIRGKDLKITMVLRDGSHRREVVLYHRVKRYTPSSYVLFERMNNEMGFSGYYLYKTVGGIKVKNRDQELREGRRVKLIEVIVEQMV